MPRYNPLPSHCRWMGTPPPSGQGVFLICNGKRLGGVLASSLLGMSKGKPFAAHRGEWLEFVSHHKTLDDAKAVVEKELKHS